MDLVDCRLVVNIARTESLTHGGRDTFLSLPAASLRLKSLEGELGLRLFHRKHNGMALTEAGRSFLLYAERVLASVDEMHLKLHEFKDKGRRFLRVAASSSYVTDYLPALVKAYLSQHPDVSITVHAARKEEIETGIMHDRFDIGFISSPETSFSVETIDFGLDPLVMIVSASSELARLDNVDARRFAACEHVVLGESATMTSYLRERLAEHGCQLNVRVSVADYKTMYDMVAANIGAGLIPQSLARRYDHSNVKCIPIDAQWSQHRRYAVVAEGARSIHYVNDFMSYVIDHWFSDETPRAA